MAKKPNNRIKAWSYSRYGAHCKCPYKLKCSAILRIKDTTFNYAMERGTDIHNKGEHYLLGNVRGVPPEYNQFKEEMQTIKAMGAIPEVDLATTKNFTAPTTGDDWDHVWVRAKVDADVPHEEDWIATEIDYKTGRYYPSHDEQGELYATCKMVHAPQIEVVDVEFWYLDSGDVKSFRYTAKQLPMLKKKWIKKATPMLTDRKFEPNPGSECNRCFFSKRKNGPCRY